VIRINRAGYLYIITTVLIGFSAVNTGNNLVFIVTSALMSYMLVSGIFGRKNILGLNAILEFPEEVFAGTESPVGIRLVDRKSFMPAFLVQVRVGDHETFFPFVSAKSSATNFITMTFPQRGFHEVKGCRISSTFPFNFFTRFNLLKESFPLIVFPKPARCELVQSHDFRSLLRGENPSNSPGYDSDLLSIRDYVPGDHPRYISWKSTAKAGTLKTRELSSIQQQTVMIDFDRMDRRNLEQALSCATYTIIKLVRSRIPVGLAIGGETFDPGVSRAHKTRLLTRLALYGQDQVSA